MKIYSRLDTKETYFELWGGSTKHPDVRRHFNFDIEENKFCKSELITSIEYSFFQWVLLCISEVDWGSWRLTNDFIKMCEPYFNKHNSYYY